MDGLSLAQGELLAAIDASLAEYDADGQYLAAGNLPVLIRRFAAQLREFDGAAEELHRRATLVEASCGPGTDYDHARQEFLRVATIPAGLAGVANSPIFAEDVERTLGWLIERQRTDLPQDVQTACRRWQAVCESNCDNAKLVCADGCWYLHHAGLPVQDDPTEATQTALAMLQTRMGGHNLPHVRLAVEAMTEWARAHQAEAAVASTPDLPAGEGRLSQKKRRGRKKADYKTQQREADLAAKWEKARDAGTLKAHFAKENGTTQKQLDALLDRVAKRNRASE